MHHSMSDTIHNYLSGKTDLSNEDIEHANRLEKAGRILGIEFLDHLIIGGKFVFVL